MYAIIDLGSNSFHLLLAELKDQQIRVVGRCSEKIQLAEGISHSGELSQAAMQRGLECLHQFKSILAEHTIEQLKIVGTEAMRRARNTDIFIQQAKKLGFDIDVISGEQEAKWIYHGVSGPLPTIENCHRVAIDIGGASTEIALGNNDQLLFTKSICVGCVSWRDNFFTPVLDYAKNHQKAKDAALEKLEPALTELKQLKWDEVYASSGSAKMLSYIGYSNNWSDGTITRKCIGEIEAMLKEVKTIEEINILGLKPQRLDLLAPGLTIMSTIMSELDLEEINYSATALREGILGEMINRKIDYKLPDDFV